MLFIWLQFTLSVWGLVHWAEPRKEAFVRCMTWNNSLFAKWQIKWKEIPFGGKTSRGGRRITGRLLLLFFAFLPEFKIFLEDVSSVWDDIYLTCCFAFGGFKSTKENTLCSDNGPDHRLDESSLYLLLGVWPENGLDRVQMGRSKRRAPGVAKCSFSCRIVGSPLRCWFAPLGGTGRVCLFKYTFYLQYWDSVWSPVRMEEEKVTITPF